MKWRCSMDKRQLISNIKQNFMLKRVRAQEECEDYINSLKENDEFARLYNEYSRVKFEYLKTAYIEENIALKHDMQDLQEKINKYLDAHGYDKKKLKPQYECKICNDTGVAGGRICSCLMKELNKTLSIKSSSISKFKSFKDVDTSIMSETDTKALEILKSWCDKYPNVTKLNINIMGASGSGKTFLMECMANELVSSGHVVTFKTAFELNELARLYHMGKSYEFADLLKTDVLFIDDLGTEPIIKNVTKEYLYNLINVRQMNNLPTIISTNLSDKDILSRYDERIFSRLANKNLSINVMLTSGDKRLIKKTK